MPEPRPHARARRAGIGGLAVALGQPGRRLPLTLELVEVEGGLVGINTMHPNPLVEEALRAGLMPELAGYDEIRREVAYDRGCRIDFLLRAPRAARIAMSRSRTYISSAALGAEFPDA